MMYAKKIEIGTITIERKGLTVTMTNSVNDDVYTETSRTSRQAIYAFSSLVMAARLNGQVYGK